MIIKQLALVQMMLAAATVAAAQTGSACPDRDAVLQINGASFTRADLDARHPALLFQARNTNYEAEKKAIEDFIDRYLLEQQAGKEGVTVAQLLDRHVNAPAQQKDPSEEALRIYYEGVDTKEPYEAVRGKILDVIRQRRVAKIKAAYMQTLRSEAAIAVRLPAPRAAISLRDTPVRGVASAPVVLVEYADYECTYCKQVHPVLTQLLAEYGNKVALAFKDAPLPMHSNAQKAAEAAHCAGSQGKYWEYHDILFEGTDFSGSKLKEAARKLKLDTTSFDRCLDSGLHAERVITQLAEAQSLGVPGTPSFFVNGRLLSPNLNFTVETFRRIVEEELRANSTSAEAPGRPRVGDGGKAAAPAVKSAKPEQKKG